MSKTGKIVGGIIILIIIIVAIVSLSKKPAGDTATKEPIKVGFVASLTGDASVYGEEERNATILALEKINAGDAIGGRKMEVIYEDGKCNGKDASSAAEKLINIDKVKYIFGTDCSAEILAMAPITEKAKVLVLSSFSSAPSISHAGEYIFRNAPSDNDSAKIDADLLSRKYKKIAIISENTDYSLGIRTILREQLPQKGVTIVLDETYNGGVKDFRTILSKVKALNPDAIYMNPGTSPQSAGLLAKQARDIGITQPLYYNFFMGTPATIEAAGKSAEGVIFSDVSGLTTSEGKALLATYKERFGKDAASEYDVGASYDRAFILAQAIKEVGTDPTKIKDYLYALKNYSGILGNYHFDQNGDVVGIGFSHYIIKDGKKVDYQE